MTSVSRITGVQAVAMGASAGGVDALSVLLPALPERLLAPVFIVLHLPRDRSSQLVDVVQARCVRPVVWAQDKAPVEPGVVYIAPPDYHLLVDAGPQLALSVDAPVHFSRPSVDVLFESAADIYGARLLGIILTGASADGAAGLDAVRRRGGRTMVQDPAEAQMPTMVEAALARGPVDHILSLEGIAAVLHALDQQETGR